MSFRQLKVSIIKEKTKDGVGKIERPKHVTFIQDKYNQNVLDKNFLKPVDNRAHDVDDGILYAESVKVRTGMLIQKGGPDIIIPSVERVDIIGVKYKIKGSVSINGVPHIKSESPYIAKTFLKGTFYEENLIDNDKDRPYFQLPIDDQTKDSIFQKNNISWGFFNVDVEIPNFDLLFLDKKDFFKSRLDVYYYMKSLDISRELEVGYYIEHVENFKNPFFGDVQTVDLNIKLDKDWEFDNDYTNAVDMFGMRTVTNKNVNPKLVSTTYNDGKPIYYKDRDVAMYMSKFLMRRAKKWKQVSTYNLIARNLYFYKLHESGFVTGNVAFDLEVLKGYKQIHRLKGLELLGISLWKEIMDQRYIFTSIFPIPKKPETFKKLFDLVVERKKLYNFY